jgi:hypothetical protein
MLAKFDFTMQDNVQHITSKEIHDNYLDLPSKPTSLSNGVSSEENNCR